MMIRRAFIAIRARVRILHMHHGRAFHHIGRAGIGAELSYHVAELSGLHEGVMLCAAVLLVVGCIHAIAGEI